MKPQELVAAVNESSRPLFTVRDIAALTHNERNYARLLASRLVGKGLARVERDRYAVAGEDPFVVASALQFPSYVSFLSAYSYYGETTQSLREVFVAARRQRAPLEYAGFRLRFVRLSPRRFFGYGKRRAGRKYLFMADLEKALVDGLCLPEYAPPSETFQVLERGHYDLGKFAGYVTRMGSAAVLARAGYLCELSGKVSGLSPPRSSSYTLLNPGLP